MYEYIVTGMGNTLRYSSLLGAREEAAKLSRASALSVATIWRVAATQNNDKKIWAESWADGEITETSLVSEVR